MRKTRLQRKTSLRSKKISRPLQGHKIASKGSKTPQTRKALSKGYKPPKWFQKIKPGVHGSTPAQKRLWRVVSEFVRQRDFELYATCVSCPHRFESWQEAQAGHWLPFSICHSWYKFDPTFNIHAQCVACNSGMHRSGAHIGHAMGEEIKRRCGENTLEIIKEDNERFRGMKIEVFQIVDYVARLRPDLVE